MKKNNGCMTAFWIVAAIFGVVLLIHLAIAYYFLQARFKLKEVSGSDAHSASNMSPTYSAPSLPPEDIETSADGKRVRDRALKLDGFYYPIRYVQAGNLQVVHMAIALDDTAGTAKGACTGVTVKLADVTSKEIDSDQGTSWAVSPVISCDSYTITRHKIAFRGHDAQAGQVTFIGKVDPQFAAWQSGAGTAMNSSSGNAITGDLTIGGTVLKDVGFGYYSASLAKSSAAK